MRKLNNIVMFACNQGGHFSQMMALRELFGEYESVLVTDNGDANKRMKALQDIGTIEFAMAMDELRKKTAGRKKKKREVIFTQIKLFMQCRKLWKKYRPAVIISTGSNIAVHFFIYGWLNGSKLIYIESRAKVYSKNITGRIAATFADKVFVQWPEMQSVYPQAEYHGVLV